MKQINLYQAAFHPPHVIMPARRLLAGGVLFLCGLLILFAWDAWRLAQLRREVEQLTARADSLEAQLGSARQARQADPRLLAEAEATERRLRHLQLAQDALAGGALGAESGYAAHFRALSRALARIPRDGAWLTHIEIDERGRAMSLRGRAITGEDSARLIASLRHEPLFIGLSFASLSLTPPEKSTQASEQDDDSPPRFLEFVLSARPASSDAASATGARQAATDLSAQHAKNLRDAARLVPPEPEP